MPETISHKFECSLEHAPKFWNWLHKRGGVAHWRSINLSNPGESWSAPVNNDKGTPFGKPSSRAASEPTGTCNNPDEVYVTTVKELQRFHIGVRLGASGLMLKVTDGSKRRIDSRVERWAEKLNNDQVFYDLDRWSQEAVILVPDEVITLSEWARRNPQQAEQALSQP